MEETIIAIIFVFLLATFIIICMFIKQFKEKIIEYIIYKKVNDDVKKNIKNNKL